MRTEVHGTISCGQSLVSLLNRVASKGGSLREVTCRLFMFPLFFREKASKGDDVNIDLLLRRRSGSTIRHGCALNTMNLMPKKSSW